MFRLAAATLLVLIGSTAPAADGEPLLREDFSKGAERWELLDAENWRVEANGEDHWLRQFGKAAPYQPPHRSPLHVALLRDLAVSDFVLTAKVRSTHEDYPHRDACLFFGYQDSAHFYYVHLGRSMDPHANQIFVVDGADRAKISLTTTDGTPWTDDWHTVRIERSTTDGEIRVFFDDLDKPAMTAVDRRFTAGRIGLGSFDDTTDWDDIVLSGTVAKTAK